MSSAMLSVNTGVKKQPEPSRNMFIIIKYGDGIEQLLVNPDCQCRVFMTYIRAKIPLIHAYEMQNEEEGPWQLDLCDESGFLRNLPEKSPLDNLSKLFDQRAVYIPILLTRTPEGQFKNLVPLIEEVTTEMDKRLKKHLRIRKGQKGSEDNKNITSTSRSSRRLDKMEHSKRDTISPSSTDFKKEKKNKSASGRSRN